MYRNLVLSGGSVKGVAYAGCLKYLEEKGHLQHIKNLIGSSIGAVICFYLAIGLNSSEILKDIIQISKDYNAKTPNIDNIINIFTSMGLDDGSFIIEAISKQLYSRYGCHDITFIDLAKKTGKNLVICGTNISSVRSEFFNVDTYPNMSVIKALRISISVPFLFTPVIYEGNLYADAALFSNFPIEYFDGSLPQNTIGIVLKSKPSNEPIDAASMNLVKYMTSLIDAYFFKVNTPSIDPYQNNKIVEVYMEDTSPYHFDFKKFKFDINVNVIDDYVNIGYELTRQSFDQ